jgi:heme exporter protein CcmD
MITDPLWQYIWPCYALAAICLIALAVRSYRRAAHWARRAREAQAKEAAAKQTAAPKATEPV